MKKMSLSLVALLKSHGLRFFTSGDFIGLSGLTPGATTQNLRRMAARGLLAKLKRGLWANLLAPGLRLAEALPQLTSPWPSCVSLHTALFESGVLAEAPPLLYGVTAGPPRLFRTPLGDARCHHLPPRLLFGFGPRRAGEATWFAAEPEKALLDLAYLSLIPRSPVRFPALRPGHRRLDRAKLAAYAKRFRYPRLRVFLKAKKLL